MVMVGGSADTDIQHILCIINRFGHSTRTNGHTSDP